MLRDRAMTSHEIKQCVFNCIRIPLGNFVYNRKVGSGLYTLDLSKENYKEQAELLVKEAMLSVPQVKCKSVETILYSTGYKLTVSYEYKGEIDVIEVDFNG